MKHLFLLFVVYAGGLRYEDRNNDVFSFFLSFFYFLLTAVTVIIRQTREEGNSWNNNRATDSGFITFVHQGFR